MTDLSSHAAHSPKTSPAQPTSAQKNVSIQIRETTEGSTTPDSSNIASAPDAFQFSSFSSSSSSSAYSSSTADSHSLSVSIGNSSSNRGYNAIDVDEKSCRICQTEDNPETMISPCKCRGSMKYVHAECLDKWRMSSQNPRSYFQCDQCLYKYNFSRTQVASVLASIYAKHAVAIVLLCLLIIMCGYFGKIFLLFFNSSYTVTLDSAPFSIKELSESDSHFGPFFRPDIAHIILGAIFLGVLGFFRMIFVFLRRCFCPAEEQNNLRPTRTGFCNGCCNEADGCRGCQGCNPVGDCPPVLFLVIVVVIGLCHVTSSIYDTIEEYTESTLLTARDMVLNVEAD